MKKLYPLIFIIGLVLTATPALALSSGGVGGYPTNPDPNIPYSESWFIYNLDLGESKDDSLTLFNTSNEVKTVKIYPVDSIASNQGNFALEAQDAPRDDVGAWIKLSETLITLNPGESKDIPFTITIPENADVGEHSGGIIIQKAQAGEVAGDTGASIVTRVGIRVYETVPGEIIKDIEIVDFLVEPITLPDKEPYYDITLTALNKSNVSMKPKADLVISGWGKIDYQDFKKINYESIAAFVTGKESFPIHFFTGETLSKDWQLLRDQKVTTRWEWLKPKFGRFTFQTRLTYESNEGEKTISSSAITVWVIPWLEVLVILLLLILAAGALVIKIIFFGGRKWRSYTVKTGDNLPQIAYQSKVSLKRLAKINKIKKPFLIKADQKILVPPTFVEKNKAKETKVGLKNKNRNNSN